MPRKKDYITEEEEELLPILLAEAEARGLIPQIRADQAKRKRRVTKPFPKDSSGFYYKHNGKKFNPKGDHEAFIRSKAYFKQFKAGRGAGKTASASQCVLEKIEAGEPGIIMNPDFENLKISTWPEFREWVPWGRVLHTQRYRRHADWVPNGPFVLVFDTGSSVIVKGVKDPESARGPNVNWLWYDEAGRDREGLSWKLAIPSVRISVTGMPTQRIVTTTPNWQAPWLKDFFTLKKIPPDALEAFEELGIDESIPLIEEFFGTLEDNRENLDPVFYASVLSTYQVGWLRDQEIYGKDVNPAGVLGNAAWFDNRLLNKAPDRVTSRLRYWDLAGAEKKRTGKVKSLDPDSNVGTLLSYLSREDSYETPFKSEADQFFIEEQHYGRWTWLGIKEEIKRIAERDGPYVPIYIEQEGASGGVNQIEEIKLYIQDKLGPQWTVKEHDPKSTGDKVQRANPWFGEAQAGNFYMVKGEWNDAFLNQLGNFPEGAHDDHIDSVSGARQIIAPFRTFRDIEFLSVGDEEFSPDPDEKMWWELDDDEIEDDDIMGL